MLREKEINVWTEQKKSVIVKRKKIEIEGSLNEMEMEQEGEKVIFRITYQKWNFLPCHFFFSIYSRTLSSDIDPCGGWKILTPCIFYDFLCLNL